MKRVKSLVWCCLVAVASVMAAREAPAISRAAKQPLTVADAIDTTRALAVGRVRSGGESIFVSPDGRWYALILVTGDLERNGNEAAILAGRLDSVEHATHPRIVARLFMSSFGNGQFGPGTSLLTFGPSANRVQWLDNERFAFLWGDERNVAQVYEVNLGTGTARALTRHATDVYAFDARGDGTVLYAAYVPHSLKNSQAAIARGFTVTNLDLFSLLGGYLDAGSVMDMMRKNEVFVQSGQAVAPRHIVFANGGTNPMESQTLLLSPDGRHALVDATPAKLDPAWDRYTSRHLRRFIADARAQGEHGFMGRLMKILYLVDTATGKAHPLVPALNGVVATAAWSPDGDAVFTGPTFLPPDSADTAGLAGDVFLVVNAMSGSYMRVPVAYDSSRGLGLFRLRWISNDEVAANDGAGEQRFRREGGEWRTESQAPDAASPGGAAIRMEVRQDLNTPPVLVAVETATGRAEKAWDLNPGLAETFTLGRVEHLTWSDPAGRKWSGLFYHPVGAVPGKMAPLVVGTHGHSPETDFSLNGKGAGLGPGVSVYAAQALANRGIAVLQVEDKMPPGIAQTPAEPGMYCRAYEAGIDVLAGRGLVDVARVGIIGYSRTGWHVEYSLIHSRIRYAAAVVCEKTDPSYVTAAAVGWTQELTDDNGAAPFGEGLKTWLERAPGFNADKVHTPLELVLHNGGLPMLIEHWEMFSRLRYLRRPVELYVVPDIQHATHGLQNPRQLWAAQSRTVDWFDFWLNGRERTEPVGRMNETAQDLQDQYAGWRALRHLHEADLADAPDGKTVGAPPTPASAAN